VRSTTLEQPFPSPGSSDAALTFVPKNLKEAEFAILSAGAWKFERS